jgi:hypothetical protein
MHILNLLNKLFALDISKIDIFKIAQYDFSSVTWDIFKQT